MTTTFIDQHGINLDMQSDKYNLEFDIEKTIVRLTNQLWKLIPMRENEEDWQKHIKTVIIELAGLYEIFNHSNFLEILSKLEGLATIDTEFEEYRAAVFKCITLLREVKNAEI